MIKTSIFKRLKGNRFEFIKKIRFIKNIIRMTSSSLSNASHASAASHASSQAEDNEPKFPDRKQDLDHRELDKYMEDHKVREILTEIMAYLVENRCEDPIQGSIDFLESYTPK